MTRNPLEAFSDGVIAIIITIMVLELRAPLRRHHDAAPIDPGVPQLCDELSFYRHLLEAIIITCCRLLSTSAAAFCGRTCTCCFGCRSLAICDGVDWRDAVRSLACCALTEWCCCSLQSATPFWWLALLSIHPRDSRPLATGHRPGFQGEDFDGDIRSGDSAGFGEAVVAYAMLHDCRGDVVGAEPAN
jgi:hypothetical protein